MAFGVSGEQGKSVMPGGDVAVAWMDEYLGHVEDYRLTARSVCHSVLGQQVLIVLCGTAIFTALHRRVGPVTTCCWAGSTARRCTAPAGRTGSPPSLTGLFKSDGCQLNVLC